MSRFVKIALVAGFVSVAAGLIYLLSWDIPAPSQQVERELPDADFPR
jgi:hypothetical protein